MFTNIHVSKQNEEKYFSICGNLRNHHERTPFSPIFNGKFINSEILINEDNTNLSEEIELFIINAQKIKDDDDLETVVNKTLMNVLDNVDNTQAKCDAVETVDEDKILALKEVLIRINEGQPVEDNQLNLDLFQSTTASLIPELCKKLEISLLNETALAAIIKSLSCMTPPICLSSSAAFVQCVIYPYVQKLKINPGRALLISIIAFSECYPRTTIEELVLPCLHSQTFASIQSDILIKIIKAKLPDDLIFLCERKCLYVVEPNENTFYFIQSTIEKKAVYELDFYDLLVQKLKEWSANHNSNLKFTKLLISVINIFGNVINSNHLLILKEIISNNKTVLKRAAENLCKKIVK